MKIKTLIIGYDKLKEQVISYTNEEEAIRCSVRYKVIECESVREGKEIFRELIDNQIEE